MLTVSDEITGEDGLIEFDGASEDGKVLWDGLGLTLTSGPLSRVDLKAEFTWTQTGSGGVDLTRYMISNWPNSSLGRARSSLTRWTPEIGRKTQPGSVMVGKPRRWSPTIHMPISR